MSTLNATLKKLPKLEAAMLQIAVLLLRAIDKHPVFPCNFLGISIIGELVGELCTACNDKWHTPEKCAHPKETVLHLKQEAAQVAVTAIRCVAELEDVCHIMLLSAEHSMLLYSDLLDSLLMSMQHLTAGDSCVGCPLRDPIKTHIRNRCGDTSCLVALSGYITAMLATDRYAELAEALDNALQYSDHATISRPWYKYFPYLANEAQDVEKYKILILKFCGQKLKEMINAAR